MGQRLSRTMPWVCIPLIVACDLGITRDGEAVGRDTVTVMTYNIFHDGERADQGIPAWPERRDAVVGTIRDRMPDALGLQEAEVWQVDWLLDRLPEYAAVARGVLTNPEIDDAETVAILYRQDRFVLEDSGHFWYSDSPDSPGSYGSAAFGGLTGPQMATWVRLRRPDSASGKGFYVYNTHLVADGGADDPELARFRSTELLVQRIAGRSGADEPFFVTGDLNLIPGEWPLRYLLGSRCESSSDCTEPPPVPEFRMIDAWASQHPGSDAGSRCNAVTGRAGARVDYVLVRDPAPVGGSCEAGAGSCDAPGILDAAIVQLGASCPSDHRPIVATFTLPQ